MRAGPPIRIALIGMPILPDGDERLLNGLVRYAEERGAWRYVFSAEATVDAIRFLPKVRCDGAVVRLVNLEMARAARKIRMPMVNVSTWLANPKIPTICGDAYALGRLAAHHLLERGFRRFACVVCPGGAYVRGRTNGFVAALKERGFECSIHVIRPHLNAISVPQQLTAADCLHLEQWLRGLQPQVGLFWTEDHLGDALFRVCRKVGLRVPQDVAVVSAPNRSAVCEACDPPLSSIDAGLEQIGYTAAQWLDRLIAGDVMEGGRVYVPSLRVVARKSSDIFAADHPDVAKALNYIHERLWSSINASDVIDQIDLPRRTFYRLFDETTGQSPKEFIQARRVAKAIDLLSSGTPGLQTVARECGFRNRKHLVVTLRRKLGARAAALLETRS